MPSLLAFGAPLLAWAVLCFWAGLGFAFVASLLLVAVLVPVALLAGHRFVNRWYVLAEIVGLVAALVVSAVTGYEVAGITFAIMLGVDTLVCSALVLAKGRGAFRNVTRNLLVILATLGVATGASAITAAVAPVASCGTANVGVAGLTTQASADAGQCFVAAAQMCAPRTLTVHDSSIDELATHQYRTVVDSDGQCHFTDALQYGPPSEPGQHSAAYSCTALTAQVGAPGEQQVQLSQCTGSIVGGVAAPIIPMNAYEPLPSPTPAPG